MSNLPSIEHAHAPLGKRGAFEGVARRPWTAGGMGTDGSRLTTLINLTNQLTTAQGTPKDWVRRCGRSIKDSDTPQIVLQYRVAKS